MRIKKGNTITLKITCKDSDGVLISDLATTTEVRFMLKNNKTDENASAVITKLKSLGEITVDDPTTGIVKFTLSATDTTQTPKNYYAALQLEYPTKTEEINLKDSNGDVIDIIEIYQDITR